MPDEHHISSMVILMHPEAAEAVADGIGAVPGAEIHARGRERLVVTLECGSESEIVTALDEISLLPGVLSAALVYHHCEPSGRE